MMVSGIGGMAERKRHAAATDALIPTDKTHVGKSTGDRRCTLLWFHRAEWARVVFVDKSNVTVKRLDAAEVLELGSGKVRAQLERKHLLGRVHAKQLWFQTPRG